jgi:hypothetical protein
LEPASRLFFCLLKGNSNLQGNRPGYFERVGQTVHSRKNLAFHFGKKSVSGLALPAALL